MITRSALLANNGLPDQPTLAIEPHRHGLERWRIKFTYRGHEPLSMATDQAAQMGRQLSAIGEAQMAGAVGEAVNRAERYESMSSTSFSAGFMRGRRTDG